MGLSSISPSCMSRAWVAKAPPTYSEFASTSRRIFSTGFSGGLAFPFFGRAGDISVFLIVVDPQDVHSTMPADINLSQASFEANQLSKWWLFSQDRVKRIMDHKIGYCVGCAISKRAGSKLATICLSPGSPSFAAAFLGESQRRLRWSFSGQFLDTLAAWIA